jgi:hypothetical protein
MLTNQPNDPRLREGEINKSICRLQGRAEGFIHVNKPPRPKRTRGVAD